MLPSSNSYAFWLAIFRIYMGAYWLEHGLGKLMGHPPFAAPGGFLEQFLRDGLTKTSGPYHDFLAGVVVPNLSIFGSLVEFGETAAGALLLLGLFSRVGGLIGTFLALNYWMAKGMYTGLSPYTGIDILTAVATALNVVLPTGRFLGFDAFMGRRRPLSAAQVQAPRSAPPPLVTPPPRPTPPPGASD